MYIFIILIFLAFLFIFVRQSKIRSEDIKLYPREPEYFHQFLPHVKIDYQIIENMAKEFMFTWEVKDNILRIEDHTYNTSLGQWHLNVSTKNDYIQTIEKFYKTKTGEQKLFTLTGDFDL